MAKKGTTIWGTATTGEKTEWDDILVKHGIKEPTAVHTKEEEVEVPTEEEKMHQKLAAANLDELDEMEDDFLEDDAVLRAYREKRIAEMVAQAKGQMYGEVVQISGCDFVREVNNAPKGVWVVLHLFADGVPECRLVHNHLEELAKNHREVKFLRAVATECIPNYPPRNVPTLLVYRDGEMVKQIVRLDRWGGMRTTRQDLEWALAKWGVLVSELEEDPSGGGGEDTGARRSGKVFYQAGALTGRGAARDSDSDDDDDDDDDGDD